MCLARVSLQLGNQYLKWKATIVLEKKKKNQGNQIRFVEILKGHHPLVFPLCWYWKWYKFSFDDNLESVKSNKFLTVVLATCSTICSINSFWQVSATFWTTFWWLNFILTDQKRPNSRLSSKVAMWPSLHPQIGQITNKLPPPPKKMLNVWWVVN